ncbi:MAG: hypothetical protein NTZ97_00605 [Candidatus Moranbacteria bacterium]|nr:hypothetical protein [Candidatus Moranbacteria bacterium]
MKNTEIIGYISGLLVIASIVPYLFRIWQKKITPNITSWSLWTLIGFALLLTYKSSGAKANIWPAVFGFINPLLVTIVAIIRQGELLKMDKTEKYCLAIGLISLFMWYYLRENKNLVQYALYAAILADLCAAIPTIKLVWKKPWDDRPFMWSCYSLGYGLGMFAITEYTFANYSLPAYMFLGALSVALPLILYRIKNKIPLREWI